MGLVSHVMLRIFCYGDCELAFVGFSILSILLEHYLCLITLMSPEQYTNLQCSVHNICVTSK